MYIRTEKTPNGKWKLFTLTNDQHMQVSILNYGGTITRLVVPDKHGKLENIVLGYKNILDYESNPYFFGTIIGRVAGRIPNSTFTIDKSNYSLEANEGVHHLHGASTGFHRVTWNAEPFQTTNSVGVKLTHRSPDGEGGYPGNVEVTVTYTLTNDNQFKINYDAVSDQQTALTLTNHSYFNLSGDFKDTIHDHLVEIDSDHVVELDEQLIPTGEKVHVENTPFDFRTERKLASGIDSDHQQNRVVGNGYDHYFLFNNTTKNDVIVREKTSGRLMCITTNQPGMVMYTANTLPESVELTEGLSRNYLGVCFETQGPPASLHHDGFPSIILEANQPYQKHTVFSFGFTE
ncbi:aldose 1-epimerase [Oceanobacillus limi]|uniref:Aldose 1-epimerase n=1 Tax=Oceanobacillus limi TaxID=930131 RepID=A0A1I0AK37_9BACI|nr:aldose epimerase family protein [Oceanobacillus limi]SES93665.1 aldose 1-epimerase [Oceanobacillus limi]